MHTPFTKRRFLTLLPMLFVGLLLVGLSGCSHPKPEQKLRVYLESPDDGKQLNRPARQITMPITHNSYYVYANPLIPEGDIVNVELVRVDLGLCIRLDVSRHAGVLLNSATVSNQGSRLFLLVNDQPVGVRLIDGPIYGGQIYMFLEVPEDKLPDYLVSLKESCKRTQDILKAEGR